jgi:hypothetical protein
MIFSFPAGMSLTKLSLDESLVNDIPAGDEKMANLILQCNNKFIHRHQLSSVISCWDVDKSGIVGLSLLILSASNVWPVKEKLYCNFFSYENRNRKGIFSIVLKTFEGISITIDEFSYFHFTLVYCWAAGRLFCLWVYSVERLLL